MAKRNLLVVISGDNRDLLKKLRQVRNVVRETGSTLTNLGRTLTLGVTAGLLAAGAAALKIRGDFEQAEIAFETMLGSADKAKALLADLTTFAKNTPFELLGINKAAQRLLAMGVAAEDVIPFLTAVGDAAAATGTGSVGFDRITLALTQMRAKSKVSAEEMTRQLGEILPAWEILADKIGISIPEAMDLASKGMLDGVKSVDALLQGFTDRFGGAMAKQTNTIVGQLEKIKDQALIILRDLGKALEPVVKPALEIIGKALDKLGELVVEFQNADPAIQKLVLGIVAFAAAIGPVFLAVGGIATAFAALAALAPEVVAGVVALTVALAAGTGGLVGFFDQIVAVGQWLADVWPVVWAGAVLVFEFFKQALIDFANSPFFDGLRAQLSLTAQIFGKLFGFMADIVSNFVSTAIDLFSQWAAALQNLPGAVGAAAKKFKSALDGFRLDQAKKNFIGPLQEMNEEIVKTGVVAGGAGPPLRGLSNFLIGAGKDAKAAKDEGFSPLLTVITEIADRSFVPLVKAAEAVREKGVQALAAFAEMPPTIAAAAGQFGKVRDLLADAATEQARKLKENVAGTFEAAKLLGIELQTSVVSNLEAAKVAFGEIEAAARQGLATERDVNVARIALLEQWKEAAKAGTQEWSTDLETELNERLAQTEVFANESADLYQDLAKRIGGILENLGSSLTDVILGAQSLGQAFATAGKAIAQTILDVIIQGSLNLLKEAILENDEAVQGLIKAFKKFIGLFTGSGSKAGKAAGGGGGGGGGGAGAAPLGPFGGVLSALDSLVSIVTSLMNMFVLRRMEKDVGRIEVTTRGMLNELLNRREDAWFQHNEILSKWDIAIQTLFDIKTKMEEFVDGPPGAPPSQGGGSFNPAPIVSAVNRVGDILNAWRLEFANFMAVIARPQLDHLVEQTSLQAALLMQLSKLVSIFEIIAQQTPTGAAAGASFSVTINAGNADPREVVEELQNFIERTGGARSAVSGAF